jgi:hypothetical protein
MNSKKERRGAICNYLNDMLLYNPNVVRKREEKKRRGQRNQEVISLPNIRASQTLGRFL